MASPIGAPRSHHVLRIARSNLERSSANCLRSSTRFSQPTLITPATVATATHTRSFSHTTSRRLRVEGPESEEFRRRLSNAKPLEPSWVTNRLQASRGSGGSNSGGSGGSAPISQVFVVATAATAGLFYYFNSHEVPVTGRRRFNFLSDGFVAYIYRRQAEGIIKDITDEGGRILPESDPRTRVVRRVMSRLIPVSGMADLDWEIHVIEDDKTANAFVLPGGKVFVFSGILNICRNQDALAAVLGHEIAHSTASHAAERLSAVTAGGLTTGSLFFLVGPLRGLAFFSLWTLMGGYYLRDLLVLFPMSRRQESEADYLGLTMMAEACFDPRQSIGFWQRMEGMQKAGGVQVPEMLSTHPSNEHRIDNIHKWMPVAMKKWQESDCSKTAAFADRFREAMRRRERIAVEEV